MSTKNVSSNSSSVTPSKKVNIPVLFGSIAALAAVAIVGWNLSIAESRSLYVVSGYETPALIELPGMEAIGVAPGKVRTIRLAEGDYEATITGPVTNTVKFSVRSSFMDRFTKKPAWVLNVGGSALLYSETVDPSGDVSDFKPYYGEEFLSWLNVDIAFEEAPEQLQTKEPLTRLALFTEPVMQALMIVAQADNPKHALDLAEWHLKLRRQDSQMLAQYVAFAEAANEIDRMKNFLVEGTKIRPVEVDWHRAYQDMLLTPERHGELIAEYDLLLKKEPANSSLHYLRGRLCISQRQALEYYNKALMTSFNNAFAHFAIAMAEAGRGDWTAASSGIRVARSLRPDILQFQDVLFETRLALGEHEDMAKELMEAVKQVPLDIGLNTFLGDVLAAGNQRELALKMCDDFENNWSMTYNQAPPISVRSRVLYSLGDFESMVKLYAQNESDEARMAYFEALVELGRVEEALLLSPIDETGSVDPFHYLTYAVAWKLAGKNDRYDACSKRAFELLKTSRPDFALLQLLLSDDEAPGVDEVIDLPIQTKLKAIALTYLSAKFPEQKAEYAEMARKLNVDRSYPYHLIARVAGPAPQATAKQ